MSQRIVITANVKQAASDTLPTITYQWHWRRIVMAALFVSVLLVVFVYSLMGSASAEQNDAPTTAPPKTSLNFDVAESEPEVISESFTASATHTNSVPVDDAVIEQQSDEPEPPVQSEANEPLLQELEIAPQEMTEPTVETQLAETSPAEDFAETAHVASVAIGAKIDTDKVSRAVLTRKVVEREPVNVFKADIRLTEFTDTLTFFSELKNLQGQSIKHIWHYGDQVMASIELKVTTPRYRTYSNKHILPEQTGYWRVDVVDEQDHLLAQKEFRILDN
jgi:hypothetical protein